MCYRQLHQSFNAIVCHRPQPCGHANGVAGILLGGSLHSLSAVGAGHAGARCSPQRAEADTLLQIFVPAGNSYGPELFDVEKLRGGSAWGAGTFAGPTGARQPTALELDVAEHQVQSPYGPYGGPLSLCCKHGTFIASKCLRLPVVL